MRIIHNIFRGGYPANSIQNLRMPLRLCSTLSFNLEDSILCCITSFSLPRSISDRVFERGTQYNIFAAVTGHSSKS
jgi:hypothetical protein